MPTSLVGGGGKFWYVFGVQVISHHLFHDEIKMGGLEQISWLFLAEA